MNVNNAVELINRIRKKYGKVSKSSASDYVVKMRDREKCKWMCRERDPSTTLAIAGVAQDKTE